MGFLSFILQFFYFPLTNCLFCWIWWLQIFILFMFPSTCCKLWSKCLLYYCETWHCLLDRMRNSSILKLYSMIQLYKMWLIWKKYDLIIFVLHQPFKWKNSKSKYDLFIIFFISTWNDLTYFIFFNCVLFHIKGHLIHLGNQNQNHFSWVWNEAGHSNTCIWFNNWNEYYYYNYYLVR